jgi:Rod binding domain-containing protein
MALHAVGQLAGAASTEKSGNGAPSASPNPKLIRAAHEFEAQMMKELLKPLAGSNALDGDASGSDAGLDSGSGGALGEFATEALGQGLSEQGGFGIAKGIIQELSHSKTKLEGGKVTSEMHGDTAMRAFK